MAGSNSAHFRYSLPREKRKSAPSLGVPTSFRRLTICCEVIGIPGCWRRPAERGYYNRLPPADFMLNMTRSTISTLDAPAAIGTYSQAVRAGETLYLSGQIGLDPATGQLVDGIENQIHRVFGNLKAVAKAGGGSLDDAVKLTIYLTDLSHFARVNEIMPRYFNKPYPARAVVGVAALPRGAMVEADAILALQG